MNIVNHLIYIKHKLLILLSVLAFTLVLLTGCGEDVGNELEDLLKSTTDEKVLAMFFDDFDGNGEKEAFAVTGEAYEKDGVAGARAKIWFITLDAATVISGDEPVMLIKNEDFGEIFKISERESGIVFQKDDGDSTTNLSWHVEDGKVVEGEG
ncbi:MAG: hypothetical protein MJ087_01840 [Lachnospiraceae bacterium]|nr:hypothetical protein [Lachnospiraceae bacterium]